MNIVYRLVQASNKCIIQNLFARIYFHRMNHPNA